MFISKFFSWNRNLCIRFEEWMRGDKLTISAQYNHLCAKFINERSDMTVLDIGTGKRLIYADLLTPGNNHVIGCDIAEQEIVHNSGIHSAIVCDASKEITLQDHSIDFITSHYCIEHLPDVQRFIKECIRVLKPEGQICLIFAAKLSIHAILNQIIPHQLARQVLYFFLPGSQVTAGFKAYYDKGTYSQFSELLKQEGFDLLEIKHQYGSRGYFMFFIPCYLLMLLIDNIVSLTGNKNLAADYIFTVRRISTSRVNI